MEKGLQVREMACLDVSHQNGILTFVHPAFGYDTYANVANEISNAGLVQPTMAQTASLVRGAFETKDNKYSQDIIQKLDGNSLWAFNGFLYIPKEGVYIQDRPAIRNGRVSMNQSDLIKRLESNDQSVRFVPFGFKIGEQTAGQLAKNPFIIALAGEEGAEKLAEIASKYIFNPKLWAISQNEVEQPQVRVAALFSGGVFGCGRLSVCGDYWDVSCGYAFGVFDSGKIAA